MAWNGMAWHCTHVYIGRAGLVHVYDGGEARSVVWREDEGMRRNA